MYRLVCVLVLLVVHGALAQLPCTPDAVENMTLSLNYTLSWSPSTNCGSTQYQLYIHSMDDNLELIYETAVTNVDVSFLPACERYRFTLLAYQEHMYAESFIIASIPAPPGLDLKVDFLTIAQQGGGVELNWGVYSQYAHCAQFYRVIIWDYETTPKDIYTSYNDIILDDLSPCTTYEFGVMAIYNIEIEGPPTVRTFDTLPSRLPSPGLERIITGTTYVNLVWSLPSYRENRCAITSITVDGIPNFDRTYPITDTPDRQTVTTSVSPLRQDTMYFLRVYVTNTAGPSPPYLIAVQTSGSN